MKTKLLAILTPIALSLPLYLPAAPNSFKVLYENGKPVPYSCMKEEKRQVIIPTSYQKKNNEFRGAWVATISNLDFPKTDTPYAFKMKFRNIVTNLKRAGFTAVIFQVRPSSDAFYKSKYNPWSRYIRGTEGYAYQNFDPLHYMTAEAQRQGLEFHAWLNPFRVVKSTPLSKNDYLKTLASNNFARQNPDAVLAVPVQGGNMLILDPGNPKVKDFLLKTVGEIISNYNVNAIHFDDYFYPYEGIRDLDAATYRTYNRNPKLTIQDWRRANVDELVSSISSLIRKNNAAKGRQVQFGISPFGIWLNYATTKYGSLTNGSESYFKQFADTRYWVKKGWLDYVIPQIYWNFSHSKAPYAALTDWWSDVVSGTRTRLYIGLGAYNVKPGASGWGNSDELKNQLLYTIRRPNIGGVCIFSYKHLFTPDNPVMKEAAKKLVVDCWEAELPYR